MVVFYKGWMNSLAGLDLNVGMQAGQLFWALLLTWNLKEEGALLRSICLELCFLYM